MTNDRPPRSVILHEDWLLLLPFVDEEVYGRDGGPDDPRSRFPVRRPRDGVLLRRFLAIRVLCCARCGRTISPVRERSAGSLYLAVACTLEVEVGCSRGLAARMAYLALRQEVRAYKSLAPPPPMQPPLPL